MKTITRLLTEPEAAQYLGFSRQFLRDARYLGQTRAGATCPPYVRVGRSIRYDVTALDAWIQEHTVKDATHDRRAV